MLNNRGKIYINKRIVNENSEVKYSDCSLQIKVHGGYEKYYSK